MAGLRQNPTLWFQSNLYRWLAVSLLPGAAAAVRIGTAGAAHRRKSPKVGKPFKKKNSRAGFKITLKVGKPFIF